jgi:hypothetical protein
VAVIFPRWSNYLPQAIGVAVPLAAGVAVFSAWYWFSPKFTEMGYAPRQPVAYSHKQHAGDLGIDCRYCHNTVEKAPHAALPPTATCMNCHKSILKDSPRLEAVRHSAESGAAIEWVRVHKVPDFAFFDHSAHLAAGVGCVSCHGRVDQMKVVRIDQPLSMAWCLDCHRNPEPHLRPRSEVTNMTWDAKVAGYDPRTDPGRARQPTPPTYCSGCHR